MARRTIPRMLGIVLVSAEGATAVAAGAVIATGGPRLPPPEPYLTIGIVLSVISLALALGVHVCTLACLASRDVRWSPLVASIIALVVWPLGVGLGSAL